MSEDIKGIINSILLEEKNTFACVNCYFQISIDDIEKIYNQMIDKQIKQYQFGSSLLPTFQCPNCKFEMNLQDICTRGTNEKV